MYDIGVLSHHGSLGTFAFSVSALKPSVTFGRLSGDRFLIDVRTLSKRDLRVVERAASEVGKYMDEKENVNK